MTRGLHARAHDPEEAAVDDSRRVDDRGGSGTVARPARQEGAARQAHEPEQIPAAAQGEPVAEGRHDEDDQRSDRHRPHRRDQEEKRHRHESAGRRPGQAPRGRRHHHARRRPVDRAFRGAEAPAHEAAEDPTAHVADRGAENTAHQHRGCRCATDTRDRPADLVARSRSQHHHEEPHDLDEHFELSFPARRQRPQPLRPSHSRNRLVVAFGPRIELPLSHRRRDGRAALGPAPLTAPAPDGAPRGNRVPTPRRHRPGPGGRRSS